MFVLARVAPRKKRPASDAPDAAGERTDDETQKPEKPVSFDPRDPAGLTVSNAFNASEQILLRWLTKHRRSVFGADAPRVRNFGADLKDASVFYAAIAAHWPSVRQTHGARMAFAPPGPSFRRRRGINARVVLDAPQTLHRSTPTSRTRASSSRTPPGERVLFSLFLYETLPTLVPKATVRARAARGGDRKDVALTNLDVAVAYRAARRGGDSDKQFALDSRSCG